MRLIVLLMGGLLLVIGATLFIGQFVPEAWLVIYARREPEGHWTLRLAETERGITRPFEPAYTFDTEPILSPDRRFAAWAFPGRLYIMNFDRLIPVSISPAGYTPVWSPDSRALAYISGGDLMILRLDEAGNVVQQPTHITPTRSDASIPRWSPDNMSIAFQLYRNNNQQTFVSAVNGADRRQIDLNESDTEFRPVWSPDGSQLAFVAENGSNLDIYIMTVATGEMQRITSHPANDLPVMWTLDGRYLLFSSDRRYILGELHLATLSSEPPAIRPLDVIALFGHGVQWSPDGTSLVFISGENGEVYRIDIQGGTVRQLTNENTSHRLP